jgi:hypothetical protein
MRYTASLLSSTCSRNAAQLALRGSEHTAQGLRLSLLHPYPDESRV